MSRGSLAASRESQVGYLTRTGRRHMPTAGSTTRQTQPVTKVTTNLRHVRVPVLGEIALPPPERVAYYAGMGVLVAVGLIEWPLAIVVAGGHVLADQSMFARIRGLGEAAESA